MKYETDLQTIQKNFSDKLLKLMEIKGMVDARGKPDIVALFKLLYPDKGSEIKTYTSNKRIIEITRSVRNWLQGKNLPGSMDDILKLCNIFDCDLDYFFTDMSEVTHDLEFIQDNTWLTAGTINIIKDLGATTIITLPSENKKMESHINRVIQNDNFQKFMKLYDDNEKDVFLFKLILSIIQRVDFSSLGEELLNDCRNAIGSGMVDYLITKEDDVDKTVAYDLIKTAYITRFQEHKIEASRLLQNLSELIEIPQEINREKV